MAYKNNFTENNESSLCGIFYIFKGIIFSFILSLIFILFSSVILKMFIPTDNAVLFSGFLTGFVSTLFSGFYMSRHVLKSGLLNGVLSGILYFLILFLIGSVASGGVTFSVYTWIMLIISLFGGALGGIFGINSVKPQRRR